MKTTARVLALSLTAMLVLSGCMRVQMSLTLNEDDTASGTYVLAIQEGLGETLGTTDDAAVEQMFGGMSDSMDGATVEPYKQDGFVGITATFEETSFADLDLDSEELKIKREGDDYVLAGKFAQEGTEDLGMLGGQAEATLAVTFPGEVKEANGEIEGNTVTWNLLDVKEDLYAKGSASADSGSAWWIWLVVAFAALIIIAGAVVLILVTRKKNSPAPLAEGAEVDPSLAALPVIAPSTAAFAPDAPVVDEPVVEEPVVDAPEAGDATPDDTAPDGDAAPQTRLD